VLKLTEIQKEAIRVAATTGKSQNEEAGGYLDSSGQIFALTNRSQAVGLDPSQHFTTNPSALPDDCQAFWHSHINGNSRFTSHDVALAKQLNKPIILYDWFNNFFTTANDKWGSSYVSRTYVQGLHDCYTLLVEWYEREMQLYPLADYALLDAKSEEHGQIWHDPNWDEFPRLLGENSFKRVADRTPIERGDFLLFSIGRGNGNHCGVATDGEQFLHQLYNHPSKIESIDGRWCDHLIARYRHASV
jgi:hypothetical protein